MFLNVFGNNSSTDVDVEQPDCLDYEWQECQDNDRVGDCEIYQKCEEVGPYFNKTTECELILRKKVCLDDG